MSFVGLLKFAGRDVAGRPTDGCLQSLNNSARITSALPDGYITIAEHHPVNYQCLSRILPTLLKPNLR